MHTPGLSINLTTRVPIIIGTVPVRSDLPALNPQPEIQPGVAAREN